MPDIENSRKQSKKVPSGSRVNFKCPAGKTAETVKTAAFWMFRLFFRLFLRRLYHPKHHLRQNFPLRENWANYH